MKLTIGFVKKRNLNNFSKKKKLTFFSSCVLTLSGLGGGQYCPLTFERLSSNNYLSQWSITFWQFLNKYILWLKTKNIVICTLTGAACWEGFKICQSRYVVHILDIFTFFGVLFIFYRVRYLNILNFGHWFHFWGQKIIRSTLNVIYRATLYMRSIISIPIP